MILDGLCLVDLLTLLRSWSSHNRGEVAREPANGFYNDKGMFGVRQREERETAVMETQPESFLNFFLKN